MRISDWSSDVCSSDLMSEPSAYTPFLRRFTNERSREIQEAERLYAWVKAHQGAFAETKVTEIGRASCRERTCKYVSISVFAVSLTKQNANEYILALLQVTTNEQRIKKDVSIY